MLLLAGILTPAVVGDELHEGRGGKAPGGAEQHGDEGRPAGRGHAGEDSRRGAVDVLDPGLGELMSLQQMRHVKLWFAGKAGNWKLADYELDELKEGFQDVVRLHPTHKDSPVPIPEAVAKIMTEPLSEVGKAIEAKDRVRFAKTLRTP